MPVRVVHLVAKTHLDLGFTALAAEVEQQYLEDFFPRAVAVASDLRARGGSERLVWTTGSWILHRALHQGDVGRSAAVEAAIRAGDLAWHALPLTTHTELMDAQLFRAGLGISQELDDRFGRTTTAAKMTDVPGHTRAMVPLLAEAGVTFLHLGVNPAWPVPDVPEVFRWRSPALAPAAPRPHKAEVGVNSGPQPQNSHQLRSGAGSGPSDAEVVVAYAAGGYGGELVVSGCDEALAFLHSGDNLGPPSADDVIAAHADLRARYPESEVRASTLDAFARALAASGVVGDLPVVTSEIGDPWLFGAGSDPQKVAAYRYLLEARASSATAAGLTAARMEEVDRSLMLVAEHTWGLDQKIALPEDRHWSNGHLPVLRSSDQGHRFEASWQEQRAYVHTAGRLALPGNGVPPADSEPSRDPVAAWRSCQPGRDGVRELDSGETVAVGPWELVIDPGTGGIAHLVHTGTGRVLADSGHVLGAVRHQTFDEADYERFYAGLSPMEEDESWARWDNTKPGIDACGARSGSESIQVARTLAVLPPTGLTGSVLVEAAFSDAAVALGAPPTVWVRWAWSSSSSAIELEVTWPDKPATRLPEATWCSFVPVVAEPERWEVDKLGQRISPLDVVRRGGRSLHGVGEGMHYDGPDGRLTITTPSAPLVAPGRPNLLDADPPVPDLAGGWHVLLHDNCWGTNFPMWNEGPATFRFTISID